MKKLKKIIGCFLVVLMILEMVPIHYVRAEVNNKYPFVIYASGQTVGAISINANNLCINGNIATDGTIVSNKNGNVNGTKLQNTNIGMIYISDKLNTKYFTDVKNVYDDDFVIEDTNINLNSVSISKRDFGFTGNVNINTQIRAYKDIAISGQTLNVNNGIIYSEYGDVQISSENISVTGLIYAPYGNVNINAKNVNLNSVIVIAKTVNIDCENANINYNERIAEVIGTESQGTIDDEENIFAIGDYLEADKCIKIEWFTDCESEKIEILESSNGIEYVVVETAENNTTYAYKIESDFQEKYIKVVCRTEEGDIIDSIPFLVIRSNDKYIVKMIDTDNEGLPDAFELIYGTDIENGDTDNDGLTDFHEISITNTNPIVYDSVEENVIDSIVDLDTDNICNIDEILLDICPLNSDTDEDGLNDEDEVNEYHTKPNEEDTDKDGLNDGDEIVLKLNPCNPDTDGDGILDGNECFETYINKDSELLKNINTEDSVYALNVYINASGNVNRLLEIEESSYTEHIKNIAQFGKIIEIAYDGNHDIMDCNIVYEIKQEYVSDTNSDYLGYTEEFEGIKRFQIFKYYEDIDMLLPIETKYNIDENKVYCNTSELGTYCLMNVELWLESIGYEENETISSYTTRRESDIDSVTELIEKEEYNGHTYGLYGGTNVYTWEEASEICKELGGHLVSINSQEEQDFVAQFARQTPSTKGLYWIGGYRNPIDEYKWYWSDGTKFTYENWNAGEPNDLGDNEYYVHMYKSTGKWNDTVYYLEGDDFYSTSNCGFICEWENPESTTYEIILGANWVRAELDDELSPHNSADTDGDNLIDWNEVNVNSPIVRFDSDGEPIFPTVSEMVDMGYPFAIYDRMYNFIGLREYINNMHIVPCNTNPLKQDTDGDEIGDYYDTNPRKVTFTEEDLKSDAAKVIKSNAQHIINAAWIYDVDPQNVAACIFTEQAKNVDIVDTVTDWTAFYFMNTSVGIGQVRMSTAEFLEEKGYIEKTSSQEGGWDIPFIGFVSGTERMARYKRLEDNETNILYVAAYLRYFVDVWADEFNPIASRTDILATLYNLGHETTEPHPDPKPNDFGEYAGDNYDMMYILLQ